MTPREEAQDLVNEVRVRMRGRLYSDHPKLGDYDENVRGITRYMHQPEPTVYADVWPLHMTREMVDRLPQLKAELLVILSDVRDPEYRARMAVKAIIGRTQTRVKALMLSGMFGRWKAGRF